jgi:hypothetical protein
MKVTNFAKKFSQLEIMADMAPIIDIPNATYRFSGGGLCADNCVDAGVRLHQAFAAYSTGSWYNPKYTGACRAIVGALADLGVSEFRTEVPLHGTHLHGVADIVARTSENELVIADLKTTLGDYALPQKPAELLQLASYAALLGQERPRLVCIRLALRHHCINVFEIEQRRIPNLINLVQSHRAVAKAAA